MDEDYFQRDDEIWMIYIKIQDILRGKKALFKSDNLATDI